MERNQQVGTDETQALLRKLVAAVSTRSGMSLSATEVRHAIAIAIALQSASIELRGLGITTPSIGAVEQATETILGPYAEMLETMPSPEEQ